MGLFRRRGRSKDAARLDPDDRSPDHGIKYKDLVLMSQLVHAGADLKQSRQVIYYLYARNVETAHTMSDAAMARGFSTTVREPLPQYPGQWSLTCEVTASLTPAFVRESTDFFELLATTYGAEYDGWDAPV